MHKKLKGRRRTFQPGAIQKHKIVSKTEEDGEGVFGLLEKFIPDRQVHSLFNFAEICFKLLTKINCKLYLAPYSLSKDGELEPISGWRLWVHYAVLLLLAVSMIHKFLVVFPRVSAGVLDTTTFICIALFLCYLVAFSVSTSHLILTEETIVLINGYSRIMMSCAEDGEPMPLIANTKTAVVVTSVAILSQTIAWGVSAFSFVFPDLPGTYIAMMADEAGFVSGSSYVIPGIVWKLLLWPLELITYTIPMFMAAWAPIIMLLEMMVVNNCLNQLRFVGIS